MKLKPISALTLSCLLAAASAAPTMAQAQSADEDTSAEQQTTEAEEAQSEADRARTRKLSDRIKSVQRKAFLKRKRIELYPTFSVDLNDPFYTHLIVGAGLAYHLADSLALEIRGGFVIDSIEQSAIRFTRQSTDALVDDVPEFKWHADANFLWSPFYGKVSMFGDGILHFDAYVSAGGGVFTTDAATNPAANFGIGQRYFLTDWLTVRAELRDYIFMDSRDNQDDIQNLLLFTVSVSGFFPTSFEYEFQ